MGEELVIDNFGYAEFVVAVEEDLEIFAVDLFVDIVLDFFEEKIDVIIFSFFEVEFLEIHVDHFVEDLLGLLVEIDDFVGCAEEERIHLAIDFKINISLYLL